jgi:hypothetical protein
MNVAELIEELKMYAPTMGVQVFIDWPDDIEESSGWFKIDRIRLGGGGVQIDLEQ